MADAAFQRRSTAPAGRNTHPVSCAGLRRAEFGFETDTHRAEQINWQYPSCADDDEIVRNGLCGATIRELNVTGKDFHDFAAGLQCQLLRCDRGVEPLTVLPFDAIECLAPVTQGDACSCGGASECGFHGAGVLPRNHGRL